MDENKIELKYKDGRKCTICKTIKDLSEFRFKQTSPYRGNCNDCNKLISGIQQKKIAERKNPGHLNSVLKKHITNIKIINIIIDNIDKTDTEIAKIVVGDNYENYL